MTPRPTSINPKTGRRYDWVDPRQSEKDLGEVNSHLSLLRRQQVALEARDNLLTFTRFTMPHPEEPNNVERSKYEEARFHRAIAKDLEGVERGDTPQLIFVMPPRHGKTELATKRLAAWYSGRHPDHDVAVAAATDQLAEDMGGDVRAITLTSQFKQTFPKYKLRRGGTSKSNIQTVEGGRLVFVGRGGTLNGRGAHLLLLDDLYKDHEEARSQAVRDAAWNWFTKVAMFRRMGKKLVIITMTRWHSDDIIGRLTDPENPHYSAEEAKAWKIIRLPGIAEDDDPLGRKPGEALWPERFDAPYLMASQRRDPLGFASLVQQRPTVADGILFRRENIQRYSIKELPKDLRFYCASDHAVATGQRNDFTCLLKVGVDRQNNIYLTDCFWQKVKSDVAVEAMLTMARGDQRPLLWWAEKGHISKSIGPFLHKQMIATQTYINIREVTPVGDKEQRAQSIAAVCGMGKLFIPIEPLWAERGIDQMLAFPNGNHDDFVDALAYIGLGLRSQFGKTPSKTGPDGAAKDEPAFGTLDWVKRMDKWAKERDRAAEVGGF